MKSKLKLRNKIHVISALRFHFFMLASSLSNLGWDVSLYTVWPKKRAAPFLNPKVKVRSIYIMAIFFLAFPRLRRLNVVYKLENYIKYLFGRFSIHLTECTDVVIFCSTYLYGVRNETKLKDCCVVVDHGSLHPVTEKVTMSIENKLYNFIPQGNDISPFLVERLEKEFERADGIFVCSQLARRTFIENRIPSEKLYVNQINISKHFLTKREMSTFEIPKSQFQGIKILFVGACIPRKGLHRLLEVLKQIDDLKFELICVGTFPDDPELLKILTAEYENLEVKLVGPVPEAELADYYSNHDYFILPSLCDGFGMVTAQAMLFGCCSIISSMAGSSELIDDGINGFIVEDFRDVSGSRLKLMSIFQRECDEISALRKNAGRTIRKLAKENKYGWDASRNLEILVAGHTGPLNKH